MAALQFRADIDLATATLAAVEAAVESGSPRFGRPHLGASQIGGPCDRALWYAFRWASDGDADGRLLRLFARGQREEDSLARLLWKAGMEVVQSDPATGEQYRFSAIGGHFGGSMDGAVHGLPESTKWHVVEFKTHSLKSFNDLAKKGVEASKPQHYAQMQCYMGWTGMERALYVAVCKDDDRLHLERIRYDDAVFKRLMNKAARIIEAANPPDRISTDPEWHQCKWCDYRAMCHTTEVIPTAHCRTCLHATPELDGNARWHCARHRKDLTVAEQRAGCQAHRYIPSLLWWAEALDASEEDNWIRYRINETEAEFVNGAPPNGYTSDELASCTDKSILAAPVVMALRTDLDATIVRGA